MQMSMCKFLHLFIFLFFSEYSYSYWQQKADYDIDIVFHAAAYKHVPLVQLNPIQGVKNNILSTYIICQAALKNSVKKVLLISTDKAVRPTNIMGASKRISEIILQAFNNDAKKYSEKLENFSKRFLTII